MTKASLSFAARHTLVLGAVWLVSLLYLVSRADRGWIPHDEGTLAQPAYRVLEGELPHRDFDDPYTGGLALLHALAFHLLGKSLLTIRIVLLLFTTAFIPALYSIVARVTPPLGAGLITLLAVSWSLQTNG